jgi:hypothetical protein
MSGDGLDLQVITSVDGLRQLRAEWHDVQDACRHEHALLDHRFVSAWWRHVGAGKEMHTLAVRRAGVTVGVVPLALSRGWEAYPTRGKNVRIAEDFDNLPSMRWRRVLPIRRLTFPLSFLSSNIRGHLLLRRDEAAVVDAVLSYCESIRDRWDLLSLDGIPAGSMQEELLCQGARRLGLSLGRARHSRRFLQASLPASMEMFLGQRSQNFRRSLKRARHQSIERTRDLGEFDIREYRGDAIDEGMTELFELEARSWKAARSRTRELHMSLDDRYRGFHREVAGAFAEQDGAQVLVTEIGGRPANAMYSVQRGRTISCVLTYQAEDLADRASVTPLWERFFELAIERTVRTVDLNGNNDYLSRFATDRREFNRLNFYSRTRYSSLLRLVADAATVVARRLEAA